MVIDEYPYQSVAATRNEAALLAAAAVLEEMLGFGAVTPTDPRFRQ